MRGPLFAAHVSPDAGATASSRKRCGGHERHAKATGVESKTKRDHRAPPAVIVSISRRGGRAPYARFLAGGLC